MCFQSLLVRSLLWFRHGTPQFSTPPRLKPHAVLTHSFFPFPFLLWQELGAQEAKITGCDKNNLLEISMQLENNH